MPLKNLSTISFWVFISPGGKSFHWEFVHGLLESAIYGGHIDNPFDLRILRSYLEQFFNAQLFSSSSATQRRSRGEMSCFTPPISLPNSCILLVGLIVSTVKARILFYNWFLFFLTSFNMCVVSCMCLRLCIQRTFVFLGLPRYNREPPRGWQTCILWVACQHWEILTENRQLPGAPAHIPHHLIHMRHKTITQNPSLHPSIH